MLLYGPAGTGKSLIIGAVTQQIIELCQSKGEHFGVVDINCQPINTLDRCLRTRPNRREGRRCRGRRPRDGSVDEAQVSALV